MRETQPQNEAQTGKAMESGLRREKELLEGQKRVLELVATAAPLSDALAELTRLIESQEAGLHCGVVMVDEDSARLSRGIAPNLPEAYHHALAGAPVAPPHVAPCAEVAHRGVPVAVPEISESAEYSAEWRDAVLSSGLTTCRSSPIRGSDGRVIATFAFYYDHLRDPNPTNPELIEIATHLAGIAIERERSQAALRESEERFRNIVESATEYAIITLDGERRIASWNSGAERMLGYAEPEILGRSADIFFTPEDSAADVPGSEMARAHRQGRAVNERWHVRKDGSRFWGSGFVMPVGGPAPDAYLKIFRDHTAEREAEERQTWLLEEFNHRVKNMLSVVQSITTQTLRSKEVNADVRELLEARLVALARTHDLLMQENWSGAEIHDIVSAALKPFRAEEERRVVIGGPVLSVGPRTALALTMGLHELATNAIKYGALAHENGRVSATWTVEDSTPPYLRFRWQESGGPPVVAPYRKGFGSRLIEHGLAQDLGGAVRLIFEPTGVVCTIDVPLPNIANDVMRSRGNQ